MNEQQIKYVEDYMRSIPGASRQGDFHRIEDTAKFIAWYFVGRSAIVAVYDVETGNVNTYFN